METPVVQRWRDRRGSYRPAREVFDPRACEVAPVAEAVAKAFVTQHHYSGTYPAARRRFGLFERGELVGIAVLSVPMHPASLRPWGPTEAMELGRLVLLDRVLANAESWFVRRCLDALGREGVAGVVSHSDPVARHDGAGAVVFAGHIGTVYQALGAIYTGRASPRTMLVLEDGRELSNRAASKLRQGERGQRYAAAQLVAAGAAAPMPGEDLAEWYRREAARLARRQRHPGNHRYLFPVSRAARKHAPESLPYPKVLV